MTKDSKRSTSDMKRRLTYKFAAVPDWVITHPDLDASAVRVFAYLARFGESYYKLATVAEQCGRISEPTVRRAIRALERVGAVVVSARFDEDRRQTSNLYTCAGDSPITGDRVGAATGDRDGGVTSDRGTVSPVAPDKDSGDLEVEDPNSKPAVDPADQPVALVLVGDPEPTVNQRAKSISDRYWSWWKAGHGGEEPLTPFLAVKARVKECIAAGWPDPETVKALARCEGTITRAALQRARRAFPEKSGPAQWDNSLRSADAGVGFVQREPGKSRKLTPDEIRKVQGLDESGVGHG